jgi:hypothetical protein
MYRNNIIGGRLQGRGPGLLKSGKQADKEKGRKRQATEAKRQLREVDSHFL